jgi:hypothetical protein
MRARLIKLTLRTHPRLNKRVLPFRKVAHHDDVLPGMWFGHRRLLSRIDKGLRQRVTVYDFAEAKGSCDDARSVAGVCATVACLTEALGRVARYLSCCALLQTCL